MIKQIKFDSKIHPTVTIAKVLSLHHRAGIRTVICYCGFQESRSPIDDPKSDGLDLHRAEIIWNTFRIEDA